MLCACVRVCSTNLGFSGGSANRYCCTYYVPDTYDTFRPWTHTSDDSYIYQLSLVVATATVCIFRAKRVSNCYQVHARKKNLSVCVDVRLILVLVLGRQTVYGQNTVYLCLSTYIVFENTHTHSNVPVTTAASETEGVAAVSWMESWIESCV